jgi:hypothetical protein
MKNTIISKTLVIAAIAAVTFTGCKKDDETTTPVDDSMQPNAMRFELNHKVGTQTLAFGTAYTNLNGDQFTLSTFKYYLSNFKFKKADGTWVTATSNKDNGTGYYLINEADADSKEIATSTIEAGDYTQVQFLIGVDSAANVSGAQGGALDPANAMFWTWNSGYIMAKLEGTSPQSTATGNELVYHVGGFASPDNNLRTVTLTFPEAATVRKNISPEIHMFVDVAEWFKTPNTISIAVTNNTMMPHQTTVLADNYVDMFSIDHVHNDPQ